MMNRGNNSNYGSTASTSNSDFSEIGTFSAQFNNLCESVVTNIYTINQSWKILDTCLKQLGTARDNQGLRDKIHITQLSTNDIVAATTTNVRDLTSLTHSLRRGADNKTYRLQIEKLTGDFKDAVSRYTQLQTVIMNQMKSKILEEMASENNYINFESEAATQTAEQRSAMVARDLAFEQAMLQEREDRIRKIETDVLDANQIMRELGALANEQKEKIDSIEDNVEYATGNVEEGAAQLLKADGYMNRHRRRLCILVLVVSVIVATLITIIVVSLK